MNIRAGDWVVVKTWDEIAASLGPSGELENLPFMAEMRHYCGQRLQVAAVAHKTCDTINKTGGRRVANAIHLKGVRCDGLDHGGCQAGCLIFWKTEWLRHVDGSPVTPVVRATQSTVSTIDELRATGVRLKDGKQVYSCQATRLFEASTPLAWWDLRQYIRDLACGNVTLGRFLRVATLRVAYNLRRPRHGRRLAVALYDMLHSLLTGRPTPYRRGLIPRGQPTPVDTLHLTAGERVEVKSLEEILPTLSDNVRNRGMRFDPEMAQFCGQRFSIDRRVDRIIDERTGTMLTMMTPCIVLDGAVCSSEYSAGRVFCPRQLEPYFREIWLRRISTDRERPGEPGHSGHA